MINWVKKFFRIKRVIDEANKIEYLQTIIDAKTATDKDTIKLIDAVNCPSMGKTESISVDGCPKCDYFQKFDIIKTNRRKPGERVVVCITPKVNINRIFSVNNFI